MEKAVARKFVDDLEEVVRRNFEDADQCTLNSPGYFAKARLVISTLQNIDFCEWHFKPPFAIDLHLCEPAIDKQFNSREPPLA